VLYITDLRY